MNVWTKAFLIALRIAIGWHFLYEGLWKIGSDTGTTAYNPARYTIQATTARMRDAVAKSPENAAADVDRWHDDIVKAFSPPKALDEGQKTRLAALRDEIKADPAAEIDWIWVHGEVLKFAPEPEGEHFTALPFLQGSAGPFRGLFRGLVHDMDAVERLTLETAQARVDARYREALEHFAAAGMPFTDEQRRKLAAARDALKTHVSATMTDPAFAARIADYRALRDRVAADAGAATTPFARERLDADRKKLDLIASELLAFVNEPMSELAVRVQAIATAAQLAAGPLPRPAGPSDWIDRAMKWSLTVIGALLLTGLFTPIAAVAAAAQLLMFYLASPPWPGLPAATLGGHYLYVDRNLIEAVAAAVVATTATGRWAGLDAYLFGRKHENVATDRPAAAVAARS